MKTRYIIMITDRYKSHWSKTIYIRGKLITADILDESTQDPAYARRFTSYEKALRVALSLANYWGEYYRFYVRKLSEKGGMA